MRNGDLRWQLIGVFGQIGLNNDVDMMLRVASIASVLANLRGISFVLANPSYRL
jgi:hypothetical protein